MRPWIFGAALCAGAVAGPAGAQQTYPGKTMRLVVAFPSGGAVDLMARLLALKVGESLGQQMIVDNRPGANGNIGGEYVARAAPDGYTILLVVSSFATNPYVYAKQPFDPLTDFVPVTLLTSAPLLLVAHPSLPAKNVKELIALARARPGELNSSMAGQGSGGHLAFELFKSMSKTDILSIPYKGGAAAITDTIGGQVQLTINNPLALLPHVKAGKLRALGTSSSQRLAAAPEIPTIAEAGLPGYEATLWYGIVLPAKAAPALVSRLNTEFNQAVQQPDVRERMSSEGVVIIGSTPEQFADHLRRESVKWGKVIRDAKIKLE
ncbi:MAG: tripartite tricarboxylate transporter substrate binding protein [Burkholderiales bacterium]